MSAAYFSKIKTNLRKKKVLQKRKNYFKITSVHSIYSDDRLTTFITFNITLAYFMIFLFVILNTVYYRFVIRKQKFLYDKNNGLIEMNLGVEMKCMMLE